MDQDCRITNTRTTRRPDALEAVKPEVLAQNGHADGLNGVLDPRTARSALLAMPAEKTAKYAASAQQYEMLKALGCGSSVT